MIERFEPRLGNDEREFTERLTNDDGAARRCHSSFKANIVTEDGILKMETV